MLFLKFIFLIFLTKITRINSQCATVNEPTPVCFTQADFDSAINRATINNGLMESILMASTNVSGFCVAKNDPTYHHFHPTVLTNETLDQNRAAVIGISAIQDLKKQFNLTRNQLQKCLTNITSSGFCKPLVATCDPSKTNYYRFDGQCNSAKDPLLGSANRTFIRMTINGFEDGYESLYPELYPNSSRIDSVFANDPKGFSDGQNPEMTNDLGTMAFQILTHETMRTIKTQITPSKTDCGFNCCKQKNNSELDSLISLNRYCMPISVPSNDKCYAGNITCLNYIRSFRSFDQCDLKESPLPVNFHTPWIDLELVYNPISWEHLLKNDGVFASNNIEVMKSVLVGYDPRSMQLPGLFLYLMYYVKLHNAIIPTFKRRFGSEKGLDETRKLVTAVYQRVLFELIAFNMGSFPLSNPKCYDPLMDPQVSVEFNEAFRVMHYFIRDKFKVYNEEVFKEFEGLKFATPDSIEQFTLIENLTFYTNNYCGLSSGLGQASWNAQGLGPLTSCRFFANSSNLGADLRAWDFQFGREIGEPRACEFVKIVHKNNKCIEDMNANDCLPHVDDNIKNMLVNKYKKVQNIPLSALLDFQFREPFGISTHEIIADQIRRLTCGDRFWYNHENGLFTLAQRNKINAFTCAQLVCMFNDCNGTRIQSVCYAAPGPGNLKRRCTPGDIIKFFDLDNW